MLDDYIDHIRKTQNRSLLARIYGIFTIKTKFFAPLDIIIMQNTCNPVNKKNDKLTFDMKGSTVGRQAKFDKEEERFWLKQLNQKRCLKDLNYVEINRDFDQRFMTLNKEQYDSLEWLIKLDSIFLKNHKLMDYSLLLVVEMVPID